MNIRTPQSGNAARIAKAYLKTLGFDLKHAQALELIARLHGYTDNQAMQADTNFQDPLALVAEGSTDFKMVSAKQTSVYVTVENISVYIKKDDEGVSVDLFPLGHEMDESLASTYAFYAEARRACDRCGSELDEDGYCTDATCPYSDWSQAVKAEDLESMATEEIEAKYGAKKRIAKEPPALVILDEFGPFSQAVYAYEAEGFVSSRAALDSLQDAETGLVLEKLFSDHRTALSALGFTGIRAVRLSEDDGQTDTDIKVFVCVDLEGPSGLQPATPPVRLAAVLDELAQALCEAASLPDAVVPEGWARSAAE